MKKYKVAMLSFGVFIHAFYLHTFCSLTTTDRRMKNLSNLGKRFLNKFRLELTSIQSIWGPEATDFGTEDIDAILEFVSGAVWRVEE